MEAQGVELGRWVRARRTALYALIGGAAVALVAFLVGWGITSMNRPADGQ